MTVRAFVIVLLCLLSIAGTQTATAADNDKIVGRWDNALSDVAYLRLNDDGTFKDVALLGSKEGKYRILSGDVIELDWPGTLYGRNTVEIKYKLDGDTLELKLSGQWVKYKRAK